MKEPELTRDDIHHELRWALAHQHGCLLVNIDAEPCTDCTVRTDHAMEFVWPLLRGERSEAFSDGFEDAARRAGSPLRSPRQRREFERAWDKQVAQTPSS